MSGVALRCTQLYCPKCWQAIELPYINDIPEAKRLEPVAVTCGCGWSGTAVMFVEAK